LISFQWPFQAASSGAPSCNSTPKFEGAAAGRQQEPTQQLTSVLNEAVGWPPAGWYTRVVRVHQPLDQTKETRNNQRASFLFPGKLSGASGHVGGPNFIFFNFNKKYDSNQSAQMSRVSLKRAPLEPWPRHLSSAVKRLLVIHSLSLKKNVESYVKKGSSISTQLDYGAPFLSRRPTCK
jgi:hypothetical protein